MSKVMLYRHPRTIKGNDADKGFTTIKGVEFDWIIVADNEVEACLEQGFYKNPDDAIGAGDEETNVTEITSELKGLTAEEIKEKYTVEELKEIAGSLGIKRISRMNEDTLVEKILEAIGE